MRRLLPLALLLGAATLAPADEAKLVRYPHYHDGKVAFTYLGDIWTADADGTNVTRLTVHKGRDGHPRFSPDGRWIAFSSDRDGNLDVYIIPVRGGHARQLTVHSADDTVLGWTPDAGSVLFASNRGEDFMGKLYTVAVDGGMPRGAGPDMGVYGSFSPDGSKLAVNRKSQSYWRKYYRGAYQSDVTVMDLKEKTFKDLTDFDGMDAWPMWGADGHVYFVSDREGKGLTNIWRVPESGGEAERVTAFAEGDVRWPAISADGKTIVFEHEYRLWKLDLPSREAKAIPLEIAAEMQESLVEFRDFDSQADDYDVAPNGRRVAVSVRGEIFTAPTDEGDLRQLTEGAARDRNIEYSPDGKTIAYVSDRSGREEIWAVAEDGAGGARQVTDLDALKSAYAWSPDSKQIAFTTTEGKLYVVAAEREKGEAKEIASSKHGNIARPSWSPDGKWIAFERPDQSRSTDVYLVPVEGGDARKVTFDSAGDRNPRFSADGRKLYFVRSDQAGDSPSGGDRPSSQLFVIYLERQEKDPEEAESRTDPTNPMEATGRAIGPRTVPPAKDLKIDWDGLKRRTQQVTRGSSPVFAYTPAQDGKTLVFATTEGGSGRGGGVPTIYAILDNGKRLTRITSGSPASSDDSDDGDRPRGSRGGFGGRVANLRVTMDGRTLFFQEGESVYSVPLPALGPGGGGAERGARGGGVDSGGSSPPAGPLGGGGSGGGPRRRVSFRVTVQVDKAQEWEEMFDDAWRTMKYRFYDPKMHGHDWDAMRARYRPLVQYVGDTPELMNLINEMIGELNASHTGASAARGRGRGEGGPVSTSHLGVELQGDDEAGRYKVAHVYEGGPADKDWIKVRPGDYLLAIDGKPIKIGANYWRHLNRRLNRKVELTLNDTPTDEGSWKVRYEPVSSGDYAQLRYDRWVKDRRALVDRLSDGRVGYLHIKAMDRPSLAKFKKELAEFRHKEALVIDERFNGGGNIEQELLAVLVQRPYQVWQPRGTEPTQRPFAGFFGPKVVLQNWRSASNAEMFPAGFRALGLGKVVGTPTTGAVIGTGSYSLIDGSTIRTPGVGVFLADEARTNMENTGVKPDVFVENSPEDNLAGRDHQLEVAVAELLKQIKPTEAVAEEGSRGADDGKQER